MRTLRLLLLDAAVEEARIDEDFVAILGKRCVIGLPPHLQHLVVVLGDEEILDWSEPAAWRYADVLEARRLCHERFGRQRRRPWAQWHHAGTRRLAKEWHKRVRQEDWE